MTDPMEKVEMTAFDAARIKAIDHHALLEHSIAGLLCPLLGVKKQAFTVFFRISNTRARYSIIDALLRDAKQTEARKFWQSIEKELTKIDGTRNNIVHWTAIVDLGVVGGPDHLKQAAQKYLRPGHTFEPQPRLTIEDMNKFVADASKLVTPLTILNCYLSGQFDVETREALKQIFRQPINDQTQVALLQCLTPIKS